MSVISAEKSGRSSGLEMINRNVTVHKAQKWYAISQPIVPRSLALDPATLRTVQEVSLAFSEIELKDHGLTRTRIDAASSLSFQEQRALPHLNSLFHPLGEVSIAKRFRVDFPQRFESEKHVFAAQVESVLGSIDSHEPQNFIDQLLVISAMVQSKPKVSLRSETVRLAGDKSGWHWQFPAPRGIEMCLIELHKVLRERTLLEPLVEATVAYGILNWMHPFADGNGRTSRVVFNALLQRRDCQGERYLPIKEINYLSRGGHEIRLRYTVASGDWKELLEYFTNAIAVYEVLTR